MKKKVFWSVSGETQKFAELLQLVKHLEQKPATELMQYDAKFIEKTNGDKIEHPYFIEIAREKYVLLHLA